MIFTECKYEIQYVTNLDKETNTFIKKVKYGMLYSKLLCILAVHGEIKGIIYTDRSNDFLFNLDGVISIKIGTHLMCNKKQYAILEYYKNVEYRNSVYKIIEIQD